MKVRLEPSLVMGLPIGFVPGATPVGCVLGTLPSALRSDALVLRPLLECDLGLTPWLLHETRMNN